MGLWLNQKKQVRSLTVLEFLQYYDGLRVWDSGLTVLVNSANRIVGAQSSYDHDLPDIRFDLETLDEHSETITPDRLAASVAFNENRRRLETIRKDFLKREAPLSLDVLDGSPTFEVAQTEQVIFRYDVDKRKHGHSSKSNDDISLVERALDLVLPEVDESIKSGEYRVATSVLFSISLGSLRIHWRAVIDSGTDSVLYLRPLVDMAPATGYVYDHDPPTKTGDLSIVPTASTDVLNGPRTPRPLPTVILPNLVGQYIEIAEICPITSSPPTSGSGRFDFDADTDDFAAVNAYYHCDAVFRMVEEMGFDMTTYFDGTNFPVRVDHRGSFACVNAAAWSNGSGLDFFTYGLEEAGAPVGIATDVRIVLHEFGHAILFDHVSDGSFGFAHSCGDSLAAVLCDPRSKAPDRFLTFPWLTAVPRRHDRSVSAGWAWGGTQDDGNYQSEEILATSHFRAYRSLGGDHPDVCEREWAARYMAFLMIYGVGTLTPATNPNNPESWSELVQFCDKTSPVFEGHPGGTVHKVIRWAFELQGAYQPAGSTTPVNGPGAPPAVDVYINDGRKGTYEFTRDWCNSTEIWNRHSPDGNPAHQIPLPGLENYAYAIVRNRGLEGSAYGRVRAFHKRDSACCTCCDDCAELSWPHDFVPMITEGIRFGPIGPGEYAIIGPFAWRPQPGDCMMMVADSEGDMSNLAYIEKGQTVLTKRLVPFDNNIAVRCICKQCNPDYSSVINV